jgi:hypothetical protein
MKVVPIALLADMFIPGKNFGITSEKTGAGDAFVLMTLGFLFFLFGAFAFAAWGFWKRETKPEPHVQLLMELEHAEDEPTAPQAEPLPQPKAWEQPADWWKDK